MTTLLLGVLAFTLVTLILVSGLLAARAWLVGSGVVQISINGGGDRDVTANAGDTLLGALAGAGLFLPSACGGKGTCGACRVRVVHGGGSLLPTEATHVGRAEAGAGWRLACQLKVRSDLAIEVPGELFAVERLRCRVLQCRNVATFIREIVLELPPEVSFEFRAGGYVQVECPPHHVRFADFRIEDAYRSEWDRYDLWSLESETVSAVTRAYSLANPPAEREVLTLNVRIATPPPGSRGVPPGIASSWLFSLEPGDSVDVMGPFGEFFARDTLREMVFVGGGAGMAPIRSHILDQLERLQTDRQISFWYGARSLREAFYVEDFDRLAREHPNFQWHLALSEPLPEDDWDGPTGFIHQVLYERYLGEHPEPEEVEYYVCGPPVMIEACRQMLLELGVDPRDVMFDDFG